MLIIEREIQSKGPWSKPMLFLLNKHIAAANGTDTMNKLSCYWKGGKGAYLGGGGANMKGGFRPYCCSFGGRSCN